MRSTRKNITIILYIITAVLLGIALGMAVFLGFNWGLRGMYAESLPEVTGQLVRHPRVILTTMLVLLFIFLMAAGSWIGHTGKKECMIAGVLMTVFLLGVQLWIVFGLNIIQNTDSFEVQDQAMAIAKGILKSVDYKKSAYFRKYGNNDLYLLQCIGMYRFCQHLHIRNWSKFFALFNMACIDSAILMSCGTIAKLKNRRTALRVYLLSVLNPMNYLFIHWTYTCTFSIPVMMLSVCLAVYVRRRRGQHTVRKALCIMLMGLVTVIGYFLRPTAVFPTIAVVLCALLYRIPSAKDHISKQNALPVRDEENKEALRNAGRRAFRRANCRKWGYRVVVLALTVCMMGGTAKLIKTDTARYNTNNEYNFPLEHWLMVGITGNGRLSSEDMKYTSAFPTKEEKKEADRAAIREALHKRGAFGTAIFLLRKIGVTWSDGTDEYYQRTSQSENSQIVLYQLVSGADRGGLMLYCQAFRILLLLFAIIGIIREICHGAKNWYFAVFTVTVLGGLVFYMFWEGKPVYSLPFMPFLALLGSWAWNPMSRAYYENVEQSRAARRTERIIIVAILAVTVGIVGFHTREILYEPEYTTWSIVNSSPAIRTMVPLKAGDEMTQDFYPAYRFNRILLVNRQNNRSNGLYFITVSRGNNDIVHLMANSMDMQGEEVILKFGDVTPKRGERFRITIENISDTHQSIEWGVRKCYVLSQYKGRRYLNGRAQVGDTLMDVYESQAWA